MKIYRQQFYHNPGGGVGLFRAHFLGIKLLRTNIWNNGVGI
jgi:hypothetical protein